VSTYGTPDPSLTQAEWAWCAGLFEGEGCIAFNGRSSVTLTVASIDRDVVDSLDSLWPSPSGLRPIPKSDGSKLQWGWHVSARDRVRGFLVGVRPWLGERRGARADEALARLAANRGQGKWTHCKRGLHELTPENIYGPGRRCRACLREYQQTKGRSRAA
jgi:hypothetical protein